MKKLFLCIFFSIGFNQLHAAINPEITNAVKRTCSYIKPILENSYEYIKAIDQKYVAFGALLFGFAFIYFKKNNATTKIYKPIPKESQKDAHDLTLNLLTQNKYYFSDKDNTSENDTVWQNAYIQAIFKSGNKTTIRRNTNLGRSKYILTLERDSDKLSVSTIENDVFAKTTYYAIMKNNAWELGLKHND